MQQQKQKIDPHKLDKVLPHLLNGESGKLEKYIPNLLAVEGLDRERYDYRTTMYKRQNLNSYNANIISIHLKLEAMKQKKQEIIIDLARLKDAVDNHHEKTHKPPLI